MKTPRIYVACLASYNAGISYGAWINLDDAEEVRIDIAEMLANSSISAAEEYAIHDYENIGEIGEYEDIDELCALSALITEFGEVAIAVKDLGGTIAEARTQLEEGYHGTFDSKEDWARKLAEDSNEALGPLAMYIDFEAYARDLFCGDFFSIETDCGVAIFSNI